VDPRAGLDDMEKTKFLSSPGLELRHSVAQPAASRYTDYAIPAQRFSVLGVIWIAVFKVCRAVSYSSGHAVF
jgi:hypothetical protein